MKNITKTLFASTLAALALNVSADPFKIEANGTYMISNTEAVDTTTANFIGIASKTMGAWSHQYRAEALGSSTNNGASSERYLLSGLIASEIAPKTQFFAKALAEKDRATVLDYNAMVTVGLARTFFNTPVHTLRGEVGVGNRFSKEKAGDSFNEAIGTLGARYDRNLTEQLLFTQELGAEMGSELKTYRSRTALSIALNKNISALVSYQHKRDDFNGDSTDSGVTSFGVKYVN